MVMLEQEGAMQEHGEPHGSAWQIAGAALATESGFHFGAVHSNLGPVDGPMTTIYRRCDRPNQTCPHCGCERKGTS